MPHDRCGAAAQDCGSCIFSMKALVQQQRERECEHLHANGAAS